MIRNKILTGLTCLLTASAVSTSVQAASVTVTVTEDLLAKDSECTLREAIQSVNDDVAAGGCVASGIGVIDTVELPAGDYVLSITGVDNDNVSGDLDVLANLTLNGVGAASTSISAQGLEDNNGPERVLDIDPLLTNLNVTLNGVTIRDGNEVENGGGIRIQSDVVAASVLKMGIFDGSFTLANLNDIDVVDNESGEDGGGIFNFQAFLIINDSLIAGNLSDEGAGGIDHTSGVQELQISNSVIDNNTGPFGGGVNTDGFALIDSTTISNNTESCAGGGILVEDGEAILTNSTVSGNRVDGDCQVNTGGVAPVNVGGGIALASDVSLDVVNSTISGNFAPAAGGGILLAVFNFPAPAPITTIKLGRVANPGVRLFNVTIADNSSDNIGGGVGSVTINPLGATPPSLSAANTIIADNSAPTGPDCRAVFTSQGYNLVENTSGCDGFTGTGDQTGIDPSLGALADNGGPTLTHALLSGSPAIDTANPSGCLDNDGAVLNRDQRGSTRPVNATGLATAICDIGAYEFQVTQPTPSPTPTPTLLPFLLNGTGCALQEQSTSGKALPASLLLFVGLSALAYRRRQNR